MEQPRRLAGQSVTKGLFGPWLMPHAIEKPRKSGYPLSQEGDGMARHLVLLMAILLGLSGATGQTAEPSPALDALIAQTATEYKLPPALLHRIIKRESNYNPSALFRGNWGLMQIKFATAKSMGYRGEPKGLLDAATNLKYGGRYLAGAYLVAGGNAERAARLYRSGYYYEAKRKGLLEEIGLKAKKKK
jgi:soluble lytic murein transglycosylase-like protein